MTFPLAVVDAVKKAAALSSRPFLVGYRISPEEMENPGITMEDTLSLVEALSQKQLDYLHGKIGLQLFANYKGMVIDSGEKDTEALWFPYSEEKLQGAKQLLEQLK